jgi:hypothetical protein
VAVWRSRDEGATWTRIRTFPAQDVYNAAYARRLWDVEAPFDVFWADGDAAEPSESRLYFESIDGGH